MEDGCSLTSVRCNFDVSVALTVLAEASRKADVSSWLNYLRQRSRRSIKSASSVVDDCYLQRSIENYDEMKWYDKEAMQVLFFEGCVKWLGGAASLQSELRRNISTLNYIQLPSSTTLILLLRLKIQMIPNYLVQQNHYIYMKSHLSF